MRVRTLMAQPMPAVAARTSRQPNRSGGSSSAALPSPEGAGYTGTNFSPMSFQGEAAGHGRGYPHRGVTQDARLAGQAQAAGVAQQPLPLERRDRRQLAADYLDAAGRAEAVAAAD